ncbi:MAG: carbohydrate binding domain-containing protein [Caldilineaceae bacterium]
MCKPPIWRVSFLLAVALLNLSSISCVHAQEVNATDGWFSFTQSGSDSSDTPISAADLLVDQPGEDPATVIDKRGFVQVDGAGHFVFENTGQRVRFWGVNLAAGAAFPPSPAAPPRTGETATADSAEQLAARLAKLGFNAVRLHHLDNMNWSGDGHDTIWQDAGNGTRQINPEQLDRIDYLIYQLKQHAIYVNLNLFVSRTFQPADGVTDALALQQSAMEFDKGPTIFDPVMLSLQKEYAATLLNHVNPYTGLAYKKDPVFYSTETNNENSLFLNLTYDQLNHRAGDPKSMPEFYSRELDGWSPLAGGSQINRLNNPSFDQGESSWFHLEFEGAKASYEIADYQAVSNTLHVTVNTPSSEDWHVQLGQAQLTVEAGKRYHVSFAIAADRPLTITAMATRAIDPYSAIGWNESIPVGTDWVEHSFEFTATETLYGQARILFNFGTVPAGSQVYLDNLHFVEADAFPGWQGWLYDKYGSTAAIAAAWKSEANVSEDEMLSNGGFEDGLNSWFTQSFAPAQGSFSIDNSTVSAGNHSLLVNITLPSADTWRIQAINSPVNLQAGQRYQLSFDAKAQGGATMGAAVAQNHDPYQAIGTYQIVNLTDEWQHFSLPFVATASDANSRVNFDLAQLERTIWLDNVSLKPLNPVGLAAGESLEANSIARLPRSQWQGYSEQRIRDLVQFYTDTESAFYGGMHDTLQTIGAKMLNTGTANFNDNLPSAYAMAQTDYVDNHIYWDHPSWPNGIPWTADNWVINNKAWVNAPFDGLFDKALTAVKGKPFTLTEFREVTPNRYEAEGPLLMATFANLQDWDGIFLFSYAPDADTYNAEAPTVGGFFDLVGNPIQLGIMPIAARIFQRQQNAPAPVETLLQFSAEQMADSTTVGWQGSTKDYLVDKFTVNSAAAFGSRLRISDTLAPISTTVDLPAPDGPLYQSAGGQLRWQTTNPDHYQYTIDAPHLQGAIGFTSEEPVVLSNLTLTVTGQPITASTNADFAAITLQSLDQRPISQTTRLLLGVFTRFENTGYQWNDAHTSLDANWGAAPALVEPIRFEATLGLLDPANASVKILNSQGAVSGSVPVQQVGGKLHLTVDTARDQTMWYLIETAEPTVQSSIYLPSVTR